MVLVIARDQAARNNLRRDPSDLAWGLENSAFSKPCQESGLYNRFISKLGKLYRVKQSLAFPNQESANRKQKRQSLDLTLEILWCPQCSSFGAQQSCQPPPT